MENAADALKISFAVFVFIFAIAVAFSVIGKAKQTGDFVLYYSDKTNFYETEASKEQNRVVDYTEIVSTLYRSVGDRIVVDIKGTGIPNISNDLKNLYYDGNNQLKGKTEEEINEFIKKYASNLIDKQYVESFVEVPYSGAYKKSNEDGSEITVTDGGKILYITYTKQ